MAARRSVSAVRKAWLKAYEMIVRQKGEIICNIGANYFLAGAASVHGGWYRGLIEAGGRNGYDQSE